MRSLLPVPLLVITALVLGLAGPADTIAQTLGLPDRSPAASVYERVGVTDMNLVYHRPAVRDREIWGGVVPYGFAPPLAFFGNGREFPWRTGANENTTIYFEHDVLVEGKLLAAGTYGLHTIPTTTTWTIIFSKDYSSWGSFFYEQEKDALRVTVTPTTGPFQERMGFDFVDQDDAGAITIELSWADLVVPFRVQVADYQQTVLASIDDELRGRPGLSPSSWNAAVNYCVNTSQTNDLCVKWADTAIQRNPGFNARVAKANLQKVRGEEAEATATIETAVATATENELNNYGYQLLQRGDVDSALAIFTTNVERHPESWNVHDSLAEGYATKGDAKKAIQYYSRALEMAPDQGQRDRIQAALSKLRSGTD